MSEYIGLGLTCGPGQIWRSAAQTGQERCVSAKQVALREAAAASATAAGAPQPGFLSQYKWLLLLGGAAAVTVYVIKRRRAGQAGKKGRSR
jgi:hypothetical protein